jgi:isocitrate lyase
MSSAETALNINDQNYINTSNREIDSRWNSLERLYSPRDVQKLRGTVNIEYSLARQGAEKLWKYLNEDDFVQTFGVLTGNQAVQHAKAGLKALYISGWQVVLPMPIRQAILILIKAYTQLIVCQRL